MSNTWLNPMLEDLVDCYLQTLTIVTECRKVFIRLERTGYTIYRSIGHSREFVEKENRIHNPGTKSLECLCGLVLEGRNSLPCGTHTRYGTVWLSSAEEQDTNYTLLNAHVPHLRTTCLIEEKLKSLALVPIKSTSSALPEGLFHISDTEKRSLSKSKLQKLEDISMRFKSILAQIDNLLQRKMGYPEKILILEPERIVALMLERTLHQWGIDTIQADSGEEALRISSTTRIGLIMMSSHLPQMELPQFIGTLRNQFGIYGPEILIMSSFSEEENKKIAQTFDRIKVISKPFHNGVLFHTLFKQAS